jgi:sugar phosphate isomerase/epimerase
MGHHRNAFSKGFTLKPKLACADFTFPLLPHDSVLDLIALLEIPAVDIGMFEGRSHLQPSNQFQNPQRSGRRLAKSLHDRGLEVADVFLQTANEFVSLAPNHPDKARRKRARHLFTQTLDFTEACGGRHVSALPGVRFEEEPAQASFRRTCDELAWRCEQAAARKIVLGVEAHLGSIVPKPNQAAKLLNHVPGLTLTLDYTHFAYQGIPDAEVEPLVPFASHFRGGRKRRLQASFQTNVIDYRRLMQLLKKLDYRGFLGVEYVWDSWQHCNEVDNVSETIQWRDFLRQAVA